MVSSDDICTMCLIGVNASLDHRIRNMETISPAKWADLSAADFYHYVGVTEGPRRIAAWHNAIMEASGGDAKFVSGNIEDTVTAFAILSGTPMCVGHLWENLGYTTMPHRKYNPSLGRYA